MRSKVKVTAAAAVHMNDAFRKTRHLMQQHIFSSLSSTFSGTKTDLRTSVVDTTLASASLLSNHVRHQMIRNAEAMTPAQIRKLMSLADVRNPIWKYIYNQAEALRPQYEDAIKDLQFRQKCMQATLPHADSEEAASINAQMLRIEETVNKLRMIIDYMQPVLTGSMHPDPGAAHDATENFLVGPNSPWRMRGIMIRVAGARKGQRAQAWKRYAGAYSINSVGFVNAEESKMQIPTRHGIFGLTVRLVWQKLDEMPSTDMRISPDGIRFVQPFK